MTDFVKRIKITINGEVILDTDKIIEPSSEEE